MDTPKVVSKNVGQMDSMLELSSCALIKEQDLVVLYQIPVSFRSFVSC